MVDEKQQEVLKPILEKMNKAVEDVAKKNGYITIIDGSILRYSSEENNITVLVKKQLGI